MTAAAQRISEQNLHERLALAGPDDELKPLGDTIDDLLARLEAAFDAQRRFVANASHELRTPLTMMRTALDVATRKARTRRRPASRSSPARSGPGSTRPTGWWKASSPSPAPARQHRAPAHGRTGQAATTALAEHCRRDQRHAPQRRAGPARHPSPGQRGCCSPT